MITIIEIIAYSVIATGCFTMFSAAWGLFRFPDLFMRLHANSKVNTGGAITIFSGIMILNGVNMVTLKIFFILIFLLILNPVISHALAQSAYIHQTKDIISVKLVKKQNRNYFFQRVRNNDR
jgi:multicomponent Na+:H+ antiporter subunit G